MVNPDPRFQDKRRYAKVRFKHGGFFICERAEAEDFIADADEPDAYTVSYVWMTPHEFRNLPEFSGF